MLKINNDFFRPDSDVVNSFRSMSSSIVGDMMGRTRCTSGDLNPISTPLESTAGTVLTVETPEGNNYAIHKALELVEAGDILVIDAGGGTRRAVWGELMSRYAKAIDLAAVIIDGAIRDVDAHPGLELPVYCKGATPKGPLKSEHGLIGSTVNCDGVAVSAGDLAVCDEDGIAFVPAAEAEEVLGDCQERVADEEDWMIAADEARKTTLEIIGYDSQSN